MSTGRSTTSIARSSRPARRQSRPARDGGATAGAAAGAAAAAAAPSRVVPFEPRARAGAAGGARPVDGTASLVAAGGARRGGSGGPAPVAAVDAGVPPPSQAQQPSPGAGPPVRAPTSPASPALTVALQDGGRTVGLTSDGTLAGFDGFGGDLRSRLTETLQPGAPAGVASSRGHGRARRRVDVERRAGHAVRAGRPARDGGVVGHAGVPMDRARAARPPTGSGSSTSASRRSPSASRSTTLTWRPEAPLPSRRVLSWQVEAATPDGARTTPEPPLAEARFTVLTPAERARVSEALATAGGSDLASAVVYAEAGLYDDADDGADPRAPRQPRRRRSRPR